jgi:hypothetical protein
MDHIVQSRTFKWTGVLAPVAERTAQAANPMNASSTAGWERNEAPTVTMTGMARQCTMQSAEFTMP